MKTTDQKAGSELDMVNGSRGAMVPQLLLKRRRQADVRKWLFYLTMWISIFVLGIWVGYKSGDLKFSVGVSVGVVGIGLFYSLFVLGWHVKRAVRVEARTGSAGQQRVERLLQPLCHTAGIPMPKVFLMPTMAPNACAVGIFSKSRSVGVTLGALQLLNDEELSAVLAHEVTHLQRKDIFFDGWWIALTGMAVWLGAITIGIGIASMVSAREARNKKDAESAQGLGFLFIAIGLVFGVVCVITLKLVQHLVMRRAEYMADAGAVLLTGKAKPLIKALGKLEASDTVFDHPSALSMVFSVSAVPRTHWLERLFDTHPRTSKRIARLERMAKELGER